MKISGLRLTGLGLISATLLVLGAATAPATPHTNAQQPDSEDQVVQDELDRQLLERRMAMLDEAHAALDETHAAIRALDEEDTQAALEALARATGKLELLVAREPELALAPVDVRYRTHDIYATPDAVRTARKRAETLLGEGDVQEARRLLSGLASELVISVTNLPLATYPDAIKAISPLIDAGEIDEAKEALSLALGTMVVTEHVVPLPVLRARSALEDADELARAESLSNDDASRLDQLTRTAREQLEIAELLGYGSAKALERFRDEIEEIERKVRKEEETASAFARLRKSLGEFQQSLFQ